ncbi:MAG: endonuclease/exonuclease/phosphatase family protein [Bacteroidales bacterium]|nr:endonuclease/exonuclease/phosphatase family protein [Bacteroidales bacterium]
MRRRVIILALTLLAGVLTGSCQEKEEPEEEISASPGVIEAKAEIASYHIEVRSNAKWTVSLSSEAGWAEPDRLSGHDDASVTVRVLENPWKDPRSVIISFTTAAGKTAAVEIRQEGNAQGGDTPDEPVLKIGSYNLRMSNLDTSGDYTWSIRKERLKQSLIDCKFDAFGIQEVSSDAQAWLNSELSNYYTFKYFSPYNQSGTGDRAQGIGFRKDAFTLSDWHFFWATDTPQIMSVNDVGSSGSFKRGGCCCILTHKASGRKFFLMNNHGCLDGESNKKSAPHYEKMEKLYNPDKLPSFFVGDMNAGTSSDAGSVYMTYTSYWKDAYVVLDATKRMGCAGTYNGYANPTGKSRIDFVFYRGDKLEPQLYTCSNKLYNGLYASDHFPIFVEMKFLK